MPLTFKKSRCTGCKLCQLSCSAKHEQIFNPEKSRIKVLHEYRSDGLHIASKHCIFCGKCEEVCPEEAISNNGQWMIVDNNKCTGCGVCVENCPMNVIFLDGQEKAVICDLCGGSPQCIKWCPKDVIAYKETAKA